MRTESTFKREQMQKTAFIIYAILLLIHHIHTE